MCASEAAATQSVKAKPTRGAKKPAHSQLADFSIHHRFEEVVVGRESAHERKEGGKGKHRPASLPLLSAKGRKKAHSQNATLYYQQEAY